MLGNRGAKGGDEWDAFSRRARRLMRWRSGQLAAIKRAFQRRQRRAARRDAVATARTWWAD